MSFSISFSKGRKLFAGMDQPEPANNQSIRNVLALELKKGKDWGSRPDAAPEASLSCAVSADPAVSAVSVPWLGLELGLEESLFKFSIELISFSSKSIAERKRSSICE